ncbi:ABC transporter substrate-binding protein [Sulfolobales archaeon HS-7]|nr:ABC transporter substrate-binding protein [Sulfolobales archaeon HS-7]
MKSTVVIGIALAVIIIAASIFAGYYFTSHTHLSKSVNYYPLTVVDGLGNNVTIPAYPTRVISLAPSVTQILIALNLTKDLVAIDYYSYQLLEQVNETSLLPSNVTILPANVTYPTLDAALLEKYHPSLIIADAGIEGGYYKDFVEAGLPVLYLHGSLDNNFSEIFSDIELVGKVFNKEHQAQLLINWMESKISAFSTHGNVKVAYVLCWEPGNTFYTVSGNSFISVIISDAGGVNVYQNVTTAYPVESGATLLSLQPGVIIAQDFSNVTGVVNTIEGFLGNSYQYKIYVMSEGLPASLLNEPGPLSVYAIAMIRGILNGTFPRYVNTSYVRTHENVTLPVF